MRTSVFVGLSVDGMIARPDGAFDFLTGDGPPPEGDFNGYQAFFATVDALLVGRNTYDVVSAFPEWPYGGTPVFVLSHRALGTAPTGAVVERLEGAIESALAALAERGVEHLYVDGGDVVQQLLRAGRADRLVLTRVPVLIGSGIPLFGALDGDLRMRHVATRVLDGGAVQSEYEAAR